MKFLTAMAVVAMSAQAYAANLIDLSPKKVSEFEMRRDFHFFDHGSRMAMFRSGTWMLTIKDPAGDITKQLEVLDIPACTGVAIFDSAHEINSGFRDGTNLFFSMSGSKDLAVDMSRTAIGHYEGTATDYTNHKTYNASLDFVNRDQNFTTSPIQASINSTPMHFDGGGHKGFLIKDPGLSHAEGAMINHDGFDAPVVCYGASTNGGGSMGAFSSSKHPVIVSMYVGEIDGGQGMGVMFADPANVETLNTPKVISAYLIENELGASIDIFQ